MFARKIRVLKKYLFHNLTARNTGGYGVHSPYLFHFTRFVLKNSNWFYVYGNIEKCRSELKTSTKEVYIQDFGTGVDRVALVSSIASTALQTKKHAQLLFRIIHQYKFRNVLELGTSLGVTTAYLASPSTKIKCYSLEGSSELASIAAANLKKLEIKNVTIIEGNIDVTLQQVLNEMATLDFVYFDANHTYESLIQYFNACVKNVVDESIFVVDDIYWSQGMEKGWTEIKHHPAVTSTIDLFQLGIVFFNPHLHKKHYKMRF